MFFDCLIITVSPNLEKITAKLITHMGGDFKLLLIVSEELPIRLSTVGELIHLSDDLPNSINKKSIQNSHK